MSKSRPQLPAPLIFPYTEGFWKATQEGRLVAQRCNACGARRLPPLPGCFRCNSFDQGWVDLSGEGEIFSYMWSHHPVMPEMAALGVYNVVIVDLDGAEGGPLRLTSWVADVTQSSLHIGMRVTVDFDPVDEAMSLPIFRPL